MRPLILIKTSYFGGLPPLDGLGAEEREHFSFDRRRLREADAVVFHIPDYRPTAADDTPKYRGQAWVAWSMESRVNYPRLADPAFMAHFDLTMTYEPGADVWSPYLPKQAIWQAISGPPARKDPVLAPVVMFQSARLDKSGRNAFAAQLMRHILVDSFGQFLHNLDLPVADTGAATKRTTIANYRFCLAQENSIAPDYVTEKLFDPLRCGTVPIYRGATNVRDYAPDHSYIDGDAYGGPKGLADYLQHLIETPDAYAAYFAWRSKPLPLALRERITAADPPAFRRLLEAVTLRMNGSSSRPIWPAFPMGIGAAAKARIHRVFHRR